MIPDPSGPFPADALEANRNGRLTDSQLRSHTPAKWSGRGHDLFVAAFFVLVAVVVLSSSTSVSSASVRPLVAVGALVAAALIVLRPAFGTRRRFDEDLRVGRVESIEGAIAKSRWQGSGSSSSTRYFLTVAGQKLHTSTRGYEAAPDAGFVRAYYLPRSQWVVNLERLPDRPLPRQLLDSPGDLLRTLGTAMGLHGQEAAAETRAGLAGLLGALAPERAGSHTPPPLFEQDPRPLAEAILGRWRSGAFNVVFSSDGTVALSGLGGMERQGRWWVDGSGHLRSDAIGDDAGAAWIAGDTLTISAEGSAFTFRRA